MAWTTPKTTWKGTDYFTRTDWRRIVGNLKYIADELGIPYTPYDTVINGTVLSSKDRNTVTDLLEQIYASLNSSWNRGFVKPRIDYGSAWNSKDLNAIETFMLDIKRQIDGELDNKATVYAGDELLCDDSFSLGLL